MHNAKKALIWITTILKNHGIAFQITGGLAARVYGSTRELVDIDIDIPENDFDKIKDEVTPFIVFGPDYFKSEHWDLFLMTLNYHGQEIDLSGAYQTKIYDHKNKRWVTLTTDFSKVNSMNIDGLKLPVIERRELIAYKKILSRPVDLLDLEYLEEIQ